jgi:hypothetical protein
MNALLERADKAMYRAKLIGKGQVVVAPSSRNLESPVGPDQLNGNGQSLNQQP